MLVFFFDPIIFNNDCAEFIFNEQKRKKRILIGIGLILYSILSYPLLVPVFGELMAINGVASLMVMNFILLIGGVLTSIVGFLLRAQDYELMEVIDFL